MACGMLQNRPAYTFGHLTVSQDDGVALAYPAGEAAQDMIDADSHRGPFPVPTFNLAPGRFHDDCGNGTSARQDFE